MTGDKLGGPSKARVIDRSEIEDGIWPLVLAANKAGYATISSCEGHYDRRRAFMVFVADVGQAMRLQIAIREIADDLLCTWELAGRFFEKDGDWSLAWVLENCGVQSDALLEEGKYWEVTTEVGKMDLMRLADLFASLRNDPLMAREEGAPEIRC